MGKSPKALHKDGDGAEDSVCVGVSRSERCSIRVLCDLAPLPPMTAFEADRIMRKGGQPRLF
jgi:hypothetical protein